jgi:hypothetical protein
MSSEIVMRVNRHWEVKCPPVKKHVVAGMLVSTVKGVFSGRFVQKKRRITIEIHGPDVPLVSLTEKEAPTPRRGLTRANDTGSMTIVDLSSELKDDDRIHVRILKPRKQWGFMRDQDDSSTSEEGDENEQEQDHKDLNVSHNSYATSHDDGWIEYRKYDLDEIEDEELHKKSWEATLGRDHHMERREIMFGSDEQGKQSRIQNGVVWDSMIRGP